MSGELSNSRFCGKWVVANSLAELLGLGSMGAIGYGVVTWAGEPHGLAVVGFSTLLVALGGFEGWVVGIAQSWVLRLRLPQIQGWVRATVIGAVVAWLLGMMPSTLMSFTAAGVETQSPEISPLSRLVAASIMGLITGPVLAFFQWRRLRRYVTGKSGWWLPANAAAWGLAMPIIFFGIHTGATEYRGAATVVAISTSILAAGATAGAVQGAALVWMLKDNTVQR